MSGTKEGRRDGGKSIRVRDGEEGGWDANGDKERRKEGLIKGGERGSEGGYGGDHLYFVIAELYAEGSQ